MKPSLLGKEPDIMLSLDRLNINATSRSNDKSTPQIHVGSLRINAKCFTDAYVKSPDEGPDIYIDGVRARNCALDGDLVRISIDPESRWKVNKVTLANNWHKWSEELMPILALLNERSINQKLDGSVEQRVKRSAPTIKKKLPSCLPEQVEKLKVHHIKNLSFYSQCVMKTGSVIEILKRRHNRIAGGFLQTYSESLALFKPTDHKLPRMLIPLDQCPLDFADAHKRYKDVLFIASLQNNWNPEHSTAPGNLLKIVGHSNSIESKMEILLIENDIIDMDFQPDVYESLEYLDNLPPNWMDKEISKRRDLRNECIFTIDPKTARDLDDAVSIKKLDENIYEVGVHIADVSHFVKEMSPVDHQARLRTTSVYLVDRVIPMLPRILCEKMCSLNPNEDKLTFSVIWKLNKNGKILDEWFGRTVIRSCIKLAYEQAQDLIDSPSTTWIKEEANMSKLYKFDWSKISRAVRRLNMIAENLRTQRFKAGALKIDQTKLKFELDAETGMPIGFSHEDRKQANFLIEEYMLLANIAVAKRIYKHNNELAFLRRHPPSDKRMLGELEEFCKIQGCKLDPTSAGSIQRSLDKIKDKSLSKVVGHLLLKAMTNAEYICAGALPDESYKHFALNVSLYTHFTSPIRRYADIIVHRLLSNFLESTDSYENVESLEAMGAECTKRKMAAKNVSDGSQKLYFNLFVQKAGFCELSACIMRILDQSVDVILFEYDRPGRIYIEPLKPYLTGFSYENVKGNPSLLLKWKNPETVEIESTNDVKKVNKKKRKNLRHKMESIAQDDIKSRDYLEEGGLVKSFDTDIKVELDHSQRISLLRIVKVYVTCDKSDLASLKFYLKTPFEKSNQDLLLNIR